ncbi:hypothetical protein DRQ33_04130 [bacterium]|nr:MAG: hypothetical protein DRQ33_04130 [bacterium]
MRRIIVFTAILILVIFGQFHGESIPVSDHIVLEPPSGVERTEELPVADHLPRLIMEFDLPDSLLQPTTAIVEAFLMVKIIPDEELSSGQTLDIYCIPQTTLSTSSSAWMTITDTLLRYSEIGTYDPETGEVFFEISSILQAIRDGEIECYGLTLVPAKNSPAFRLSPEPDAISLKCEYRPGKREIR